METSSVPSPLPVRIIRWIARVLSAIIILLVLILFVGEALAPGSSAAVPLTINDYLALTLQAVELIGLALAWKWEALGGSITLAAFVVKGILNPRIFSVSLLFVTPGSAILFILCWLFSKLQSTSAIQQVPPPDQST